MWKNKEDRKAYDRNWYKKHRARLLPVKVARGKRKRRELKTYIAKYLSQHPCVDCGNTNPIVLEFDHRNPSDKLFCVTDMANSFSLSKLQLEIDKYAVARV